MPTTEDVIRKTPGVMGGEACVRTTRVPVWVLVGYRKLGVADDRLLEFYPTLTQADLDAAWKYHRDHAAEIEDAIRRNEEG
jgi:uncharacterized protein (DUF433 family)